MELEYLLEKIVQQFELGELITVPQRVSGGFLHRMYKLETAEGAYALKLLNPAIMKRPDAMGNYQRAERLERVLEGNGIPLIPALEKDGGKMQCLDGQYYYLFDWSEGKALDWHEIGEEHCRIAGALLAKVHGIACLEDRKVPEQEVSGQDVRDVAEMGTWEVSGQGVRKEEEPEFQEVSGQGVRKEEEPEHREASRQGIRKEAEPEFREISGQGIRNVAETEHREASGEDSREAAIQEEPLGIDWDAYIRRAAEACPEIAEELAQNRELLYLAQREYNDAIKSAPKVSCICDGDMDCKNVVWKDGKPYIIDLECLDYGNPFTEMFQMALSWAGGAMCELDMKRFAAFMEAYLSVSGEMPVDWKALSGVGYSWLDWLAYNVRRALGEECSDEEERQLGIQEVCETVRRIRYYRSVQGELLEYVKGQ